MILKTNLQGTHNEEKFSVVDGFLCIYGIKITLAGVKTIMEIVNLLNVEGYKLRNKWPKLKQPRTMFDELNGTPPNYEDDEESKS